MSTDWLGDTTANKIKHSYINGFLDVSGSHFIMRNGDASFNGGMSVDGDASFNGAVDICGNFYAQYPYSSIPPSAIVGGVTGINPDVDLSLNAGFLLGGDASFNSGMTVSGNVGIGTTNPLGKLHISSGTSGDCNLILQADTDDNNEHDNPMILFRQDGAIDRAMIGTNNNALEIATSANGYISFKTTSSSGTDYTSTSARMTILGDGKVGIGTSNPTEFLTVYNGTGGGDEKSTFVFGGAGMFQARRGTGYDSWTKGQISTNFSSGRPNITLQKSGGNDWQLQIGHSASNNSEYFFFVYNGSRMSYWKQNGSNAQQNFTGQHRNKIENIHIQQLSDYKGLIVCANKNKYLYADGNGEVVRGKEAITINEALPIVSLCSKEQDKSCYGVISDAEDNTGEREYNLGPSGTIGKKSLGDDRFHINALGEGAMWVSNKNGSLESGDYITTSSVPGYGQKQNSEFLANYSVGKITMDCDFNPALQYKKQIKRTNIDFFQDISGDYWENNSGNIYHNPGANYFEDASGNRVFYDKTGEPIYNFKNRQDHTDDLYDPSGNLVQYMDRNYYRTDTKELLYGYRLETKEDETRGLPYDTNIYKNTNYNLTFDESNNLISVTENILDEHAEIQWEDTEEQERAYNIRYLDASANILTEKEYNTKIAASEEAYIAAFVGCTYHCG